MKKMLLAIALSTALLTNAQTFTKTDGGAKLTTDGIVTDIQFFTPDIVRVVKYPEGKEYAQQSRSIIAKPEAVKLQTSDGKAAATIASKALKVTIDKANGNITFADKSGKKLLAEKDCDRFTPFNDAGKASYVVEQQFVLDPDEAIYGLGILQNGKMSQRGEDRDLGPGNTEDGIPFFQSAKGYGLYWDNYSTTRFSDNAERTSLKSTVGDAIDYYFIYGGNADGVIANIRHLTGDVPMIPLWAYGFFQSKERYKTQDETVGVLHRYRQDGVPIDCMVQDWQYWGSNYLWNAMDFLSESFPNGKAMIDDIHANNAKCIISVWSSFGPMTKQYRELNEKGLLFDIATWPQSGISHVWPPIMDYPSGVKVYNCYSPEARDIYWNHLKRLYDYGIDGWWMDSTEPDHFDWKEEDFDRQTGYGSYRSLRSAYPLTTVGGVYEHQRNIEDTTRVFVLTRSCTFGQQRTGANTWSGDIVSTWDMLRKQIPAGLNFSLTGNPNFNTDLGGFFAGSYNWAWKNKPAYENPAYRELYARWMQQGVFSPMMRSHGADVPREIYLYGKPGEPIYDALVGAIKLRYSLLPYIYSTARQVSANRGTFLRALAMDFAADKRAAESASSYMFGDAILATPVLNAQYTPEVLRRDRDANAGWDKNTGRTKMDEMDNVDFTAKKPHTAYLPAGCDWYYFPTGEKHNGGKEVALEVNILDIPFFVKAGSILPIGPDVQYSTEKPWDALTLKVYPGANGSFTLYEDAGDGYNYEKGEFTEIPMTWNDKSRTLTLGARKGSYPGMIESRSFTVTLPTGESKTVNYTGKKATVKF